jgi:hypothetical protein
MIDALNLHFEFVEIPCTACSKVILTAWQIPGILVCVIAEAIHRFLFEQRAEDGKELSNNETGRST